MVECVYVYIKFVFFSLTTGKCDQIPSTPARGDQLPFEFFFISLDRILFKEQFVKVFERVRYNNGELIIIY